MFRDHPMMLPGNPSDKCCASVLISYQNAFPLLTRVPETLSGVRQSPGEPHQARPAGGSGRSEPEIRSMQMSQSCSAVYSISLVTTRRGEASPHMTPSSSIQNLAGGGLWPGEELGRRRAQTDHLGLSPIPPITSMNGMWSSLGPDIL